MNAAQINTLGGVYELLGVVAVVWAWSTSPATGATSHACAPGYKLGE